MVGHHSEFVDRNLFAAEYPGGSRNFMITQGLLVIGGLLVLLAGTFDMFDGAMACVQNASTSFGAFFDSTLDIAIPRASSCSACLFMRCRGRQT